MSRYVVLKTEPPYLHCMRIIDLLGYGSGEVIEDIIVDLRLFQVELVALEAAEDENPCMVCGELCSTVSRDSRQAVCSACWGNNNFHRLLNFQSGLSTMVKIKNRPRHGQIRSSPPPPAVIYRDGSVGGESQDPDDFTPDLFVGKWERGPE